ncbi:pyridoxamine 5'-phosphate oxidase family protein [uncultured Veillonella sp.]|uniref:pyridoxamine 5'-phosphate oxidase family protein n=1 Tax=uncultured Veillonella sp. TaxID=159268 RepID=UPI002604BFE4|nr:pyridoxamine 5'-phosphate oxidase family protein [uncultured Veillonella sp.]
MRRQDRQVTDKKEIVELINRARAIRLGLRDGDRIYIVPLHFAYEEVDGKDVFYCHGAPVGRKLDLVKATGYAAYELDGGQRLLPADIACDYSSTFFSVIGEADASIVEDMAEKEHALNLIMGHYTNKYEWDYEPAMLKGVAVIKLVSTELSCKAKLSE